MVDHYQEPKGCQWFKQCDQCNFEDCRLKRNEKRLPYDSAQAKRMRVRRAKYLAARGQTALQIAALFNVTEVEANGWLKSRVCQRIEELGPEFKRQIKREAMRGHRRGKHLRALASKYGISIVSARKARDGSLQVSRRGGEPTGRWERAIGSLTPRELDVFMAMALGNSNEETGEKLGIEFFTVRSHVGAIRAKLGLNRVEVALLAFLLGKVTPEAAWARLDRASRQKT